MATETLPREVTGVQGEQLALTTAVAGVGVPRGRDGNPCRGVVLYCPTSDFRYQITPVVERALKTADAGVTFTDYSAEAKDRATGTVVTLSSLSTLANGDCLYVGSRRPFGGIVVDVGNTNSNASVMSGFYYNGTAWADASVTDGTISPAGTALGQDGNITWTPASDWAKVAVDGAELYWIRLSFSAALDSSVTIREMSLLSKDANRGYGYAGVPLTLPLGSDDGGIEAILAGGTATLDLTWVYEGVPLVGGSPRVKTEPASSTPGTPLNVTLTNANTEYSQALPANCRGFSVQCRTAVEVRYAWVTGKVATPTAPYLTMKSNDALNYEVAVGASPPTIYLASSTAGVVVEIEPWS